MVVLCDAGPLIALAKLICSLSYTKRSRHPALFTMRWWYKVLREGHRMP